ncbi:prepilin peptidase [Limimaricola pyoseonensis]|uniref:Prepilin peptidase CpaA n=1 Tax=Limimaricola pyoseonensis TaxID=521013 RepID=A0A1G7CI46_9RHOB|nr:prepilin peptidase [Limimaricola pyoseonensis]SDE38410.1 prepilin peptidase CpaA [Limimaricola pyoseonensis]
MPDLPLILAAPLMAAMIWTDLTRMKIPNLLVLAVLVLGAGCAAFGLMPDLGLRVMAGLGVLVVGIGLFAMGVMGGGDAKMLAALVPLLPPDAWGGFAMLLSLTMLGGAALVFAARRVAGGPEAGWVSLRESRRYPLGLSIGAAALILPLLI